MLGVRLGVVGILAREDVKVLTVYVDLSVICVVCVICVLAEATTYVNNIAKKKWDATLLS
jgi:hypothetical protein